MFSVMLNVAMREGGEEGDYQHAGQCIAPGRWGQSPCIFLQCVPSGSVCEQTHDSKQVVVVVVVMIGKSM